MRLIEMTGTTAGGVRSHLIDVLGLLGADHQVALLAPTSVIDSLTDAELAGARTVPIQVSTCPSARDAASLALVRRWARSCDVIHAHTLRAGALAVLACIGLTDPPRIVVTLHNMPVGSAAVRATGEALFRIVASGADRILGVSPDLVAKAESLGALADLAIVPAAPDPTIAPTPARSQSPTLLTVGRLSHQKGLDLLLDAAEILVQSQPKLQWLVAGDGPMREALHAEIEHRNLPVELLGRRDDIASLLRSATLVVQTSRWEGQPVAIQEALHAGAAIVATDVGGTGVVLGEDYPLVEPSTEALAAAIDILLDDDTLRAEREKMSIKRASQLPTLADLAGQLTNELRLFPPLQHI